MYSRFFFLFFCETRKAPRNPNSPPQYLLYTVRAEEEQPAFVPEEGELQGLLPGDALGYQGRGEGTAEAGRMGQGTRLFDPPPPHFSSGWDPGLFDRISLWGGICHFLIRFLFGVGSDASKLKFSSGWDTGLFTDFFLFY